VVAVQSRARWSCSCVYRLPLASPKAGLKASSRANFCARSKQMFFILLGIKTIRNGAYTKSRTPPAADLQLFSGTGLTPREEWDNYAPTIAPSERAGRRDRTDTASHSEHHQHSHARYNGAYRTVGFYRRWRPQALDLWPLTCSRPCGPFAHSLQNDSAMNSSYQHEQFAFSSPLATVSTFCCKYPRDQRGYDHDNSTHAILFVRSGVFGRAVGSHREIADPTLVLFADPETTYRYFHPADCGDDCIIIRPKMSVLSGYSDGTYSSIQSCFARTSALVPPRSGLLVSELVRLLSLSEPILCVEEIVLDILQDLARRIAGDGMPSADLAKDLSRTHQRDLTEDIKTLIIQRFPEAPKLNELALMLNHSPSYICRIFASECGISLRKYITRLRLRAATNLIEQGAPNLSTVGLECGFYDQSHFTREFVRFHRVTPAAYRRSLSAIGQKRTRQRHRTSLG